MQASTKNRLPNRLLRATSPYLLQHAYNPVDWYEWGPEAMEKASKENKPILVSIGYSSCHWCHVMERECFEHEETAALMNKHLVCIKVDREERPDIDQVYMDAVQAMGIHGGWPLNVFLTPDQKPFHGGTYFPPQNWVLLVQQISKTFLEQRAEIDSSAADLALHLRASDLKRFAKEEGPFTVKDFDRTFEVLVSKFDFLHGGLDKAPKFVMPSTWLWLLRYYYQTKNAKALDMVLLTLRQVASGGIYDQVGGGFARYSVDGHWFAPHFEKMLYDNAQLVSLYSEAYRLEPDPLFRQVVYETVGWLKREMKHPDGGFYSAIDADSEGVEGKFYSWTSRELDEIFGDKATAVKAYYQVTSNGNWEHGRNILFCSSDGAPVERKNDGKQRPWITGVKEKLLEARSRRIRPSLDDKVVTGWNSMLIQGFVDAYDTFGDSSFLEEALSINNFLELNLMEGHRYYRTYKTRRSTIEGFLEDYAFLIQAHLSLYQATFDEGWLSKAQQECEYVLTQFWDEQEGFFFYAGSDSEKLIARKKELFDNVIPSSNAVMARNLFHLGIMLDREDWKLKAVRMVSSLKQLILTEPSYMSHWGIVAMEVTHSFYEIVVTGISAMEKRAALAKTGVPFGVLLGTTSSSNLPLLEGKTEKGKTLLYVCANKTCRMPVSTVEEAIRILTPSQT